MAAGLACPLDQLVRPLREVGVGKFASDIGRRYLRASRADEIERQ
jgi:hypothetical protein